MPYNSSGYLTPEIFNRNSFNIVCYKGLGKIMDDSSFAYNIKRFETMNVMELYNLHCKFSDS